MEKKKVNILVGGLVVIFAIIIVFVMIGKTSEPVCKTIDENGYCILEGVPEYLKFQEPDIIDEHELYNFSKNPFPDYFILKDSNDTSKGYLCTETNNPPKLIYYFSKDYNETSKKFAQYRLASICDTFYVVEDYDVLGYGLTMYGPYEL